ncbi:MAG: hypothetical protein AAF767_07825 [Pseudomonadota bacterium]
MIERTLVLCAAGTLAFGTLMSAHASSAADYFKKIDADASGIISQAEYVSYKTANGKHSAEDASKAFLKLAGDDGELSLAEFEGAMKKAGSSKDGKTEKDRTT